MLHHIFEILNEQAKSAEYPLLSNSLLKKTTMAFDTVVQNDRDTTYQ